MVEVKLLFKKIKNCISLKLKKRSKIIRFCRGVREDAGTWCTRIHRPCSLPRTTPEEDKGSLVKE